jgi:hypothetical protein
LGKIGNEILLMGFYSQGKKMILFKYSNISINYEKNVALAREVLGDGNLEDKAEAGHEKKRDFPGQ